ncbi:restriction endonuclease subunit S [Pseudomonas sp. MDT1-16]
MAGRYKTYPECKDSGVEWLGLIPTTWSVKPLKGITNFINGNAFKPSEWSEDGVPIIRIENLNGSHDFNCFIGKINDRYKVSEGDLLFGWSGNRGTSFGPFLWWRKGEHYLNQHIFKLDGFSCNKQWLYWVLKAVTYYVEEQAHGIIGMVHVTKGKLGSINIPDIDRAEQTKIANFLEHETAKIDTLIDKQKQFILLLNEKRQAVISHAITKGFNPKAEIRNSGIEWLGEIPHDWKVSRLKYHTTRFEQGWSPQCDSRQADDNEFGVLKVGCVNYGVFKSDENKALPKELTPQLQYLIQHGDLLISRANTKELVGSAAVVDRAYENIILCDKLYRLRFDELIDPQWVAYYLALPIVRQQIQLGASGASHSMQNIGQATIKELPIVIPPPEQVAIILSEIKSKINTFELTFSRANHQIVLLQERRTALISAAVTGKIDVRNWVAPEETQTNKEVAA